MGTSTLSGYVKTVDEEIIAFFDTGKTKLKEVPGRQSAFRILSAGPW